MSVLDSVDGKLARLTLRESAQGNWMDHGSDVVYFFLWLVAVGLVAGGVTWWLLPAAWVADRLTVGAFTMVRKRELNDYAPIDAFFRLIVIRRNVFLLGIGAGVLAGAPGAAVAALTAWTLVGWAFHLARIAWIAATGEPARASRLHGGAP
jgi:phosphatidylglycerophosphate synthase